MRYRVHKLIDTAGALWLPFAIKKLKQLANVSGEWASKQFIMPDGARVMLNTMGQDQKITIQYFHKYEFFATYKDFALFPGYEIPRNTSIFTDATPESYDYYAAAGRGVFSTRGSNGSPLFSNFTKAGAEGKQWTYLPLPAGPASAGNPEQVDFYSDGRRNTGQSRNKGDLRMFAWQNQKGWEYTWWHNNKAEALVVSCLATGLTKSYVCRAQWPAGTGVQWYTSSENTSSSIALGSGKTFFCKRDKWDARTYTPPVSRVDDTKEFQDAWDIPTTIYSLNFQYTGGYRAGARANWRRSCAQKIKVGGKYEWYIIATDRYGDFVAYRAQDFFPNNYSIPAGKVKTATAPYPAWANKRSNPADSHDYWVFTFNKDGTKATSTPFESVDAYVWAAWESYNYNYFEASPRNRFLLDTPPRCTTMCDGGAGPIETWNPFPAAGLCWPTEAQVNTLRTLYPTWTIYTRYTVSRERVYYRDNSDFASDTYHYLDSRFYPITGSRSGFQLMSAIPTDFESVLLPVTDDTTKVGAQIHKTGLVEFGLNITGISPSDPDNFTFTVTLLDSERYTDNKRFYVASGYFALDERTKKLNDPKLPPDDTLLTAEIEIYVKDPDVVRDLATTYDLTTPNQPNMDPYRCANIIRYNALGQAVQVPFYDPVSGYIASAPFAGTHNALKADEPNCEALLLTSYAADLDVFYVVRRRDTQAIVKRFCLGYNMQRIAGQLSTAGHKANEPLSGPFHASSIVFGDLRSLNFITATRALKSGTGFKANRDDDFPFPSLAPRFELRVTGEKLRTVNFSKPGVADYDATPDPMTDRAKPRESYVKLPLGTPYVAPVGTQTKGQGAPDSFLLACQIWAAESFLMSGVSTYIPTHPKGHWSVYFDPRGAGYTLDEATSTEKSGVFDIIASYKGKRGTHKGAFNSAFADEEAGRPAREYSYYRENENDMGGFCIAGFWFQFDKAKNTE